MFEIVERAWDVSKQQSVGVRWPASSLRGFTGTATLKRFLLHSLCTKSIGRKDGLTNTDLSNERPQLHITNYDLIYLDLRSHMEVLDYSHLSLVLTGNVGVDVYTLKAANLLHHISTLASVGDVEGLPSYSLCTI